MDTLRDDSRALSNQIGVILLVGVMVASLGVTSLLASSGALSAEHAPVVESAETELQEVAGAVHTVAFTDVNRRGVDLSLGDSAFNNLELQPDAGQATVQKWSPGTGWTDIHQMALGRAIYENDAGHRVAYQGGGIWKQYEGQQAEMTRAPPIDVSTRGTPTVSFSLLQLTGSVSLRQSMSVVKQSKTDPYPGLYVKSNERIRIIIESEFYHGWERLLTETFPSAASVTSNAASNTVTVTYGSGTDLYLHLSAYTIEAAG